MIEGTTGCVMFVKTKRSLASFNTSVRVGSGLSEALSLLSVRGIAVPSSPTKPIVTGMTKGSLTG